MDNSPYALFVISCTKNQQVLDVLIWSIRENLSSNLPIYISTDGPMQVSDAYTTLIVDEQNAFGDRIAKALEAVVEEQVLVFCDDFIVERPADRAILNQLVSSMRVDKNIGSIALAQISGKYTEYRLFEHFRKRDHYGTYKTTLQAAFWQKTLLVALMEGIQTPWEFELYANFRTYLHSARFYALDQDKHQPLPYNRGKLIIRGQVVRPEKERLEKVMGKRFDLSDFPETDSYVQGNNLSLAYRIKRRLILTWLNIYYRSLSIVKGLRP